MLVIVGDVVHQHGAADGIGGPRVSNMRNLHGLNDGSCVHPVAIDERIFQRLNECSLLRDCS